jgi:hypothetical protein
MFVVSKDKEPILFNFDTVEEEKKPLIQKCPIEKLRKMYQMQKRKKVVMEPMKVIVGWMNTTKGLS